MQWMVNQLNGNLQNKFKDEHDEITNQRDFLNWHDSLEGATQDKIAWRSRQRPFDNMNNEIKKLTTDLKN